MCFQIRTLDIFGVKVSMQALLILFISIVLMILLQFIVQKTKIGRAMRAVSYDKDAARLMGINVDNTISATFAIGSALPELLESSSGFTIRKSIR